LVDSLLLAPFALYPKTGAFSIFITAERNSNNNNNNKKKKKGVTNRVNPGAGGASVAPSAEAVGSGKRE